jgi:hypothetical protein
MRQFHHGPSARTALCPNRQLLVTVGKSRLSIVVDWTLISYNLVLDSSTGKPAEGVVIRLQELEVSDNGGPDIFHPLAKG